MAFNNDADAVEGVIGQLAALSYEAVSFVLVDDGSTDGTGEKLAQLAAAHPGMRVIHNPERVGVAIARNRAIALATGEYLWFADSDDRWTSLILDELVAGLEQSPAADLVVGGASVETVDGIRLRTLDEVATAGRMPATQAMAQVLSGSLSGYLWNKLFRRSLVGEFPDQRSLSDLPFVAEFVARSSVVVRVPGLQYSYVQGPESITRSRSVDVSDLSSAARAVIDAAQDAPAESVTTFRYWFAVVPAHTQWALRRERASGEIAGLDVRVRMRDIRTLWRHDRRTALKALWILCAGPAFPGMYRALVGRARGNG